MNYFNKIQFKLAKPYNNEQVSYCGVDCKKCYKNQECEGCIASGGKPFGGECVIAECCKKNAGHKDCGPAYVCDCYLKQLVIGVMHNCGIDDLKNYDFIFEVPGFLLNLECKYPDGSIRRPFDDKKIYISGQYRQSDSDRRYTAVADKDNFWLIEHDENGSNAVLIVNKRYSSEIL